MKKELQEELYERYPEIFEIGRDIPNRDELYEPIHTGITCESGWYRLIDSLCFAIMQICRNKQVKPPRATQIKQKFAGLRFYHSGVDESAYEKISGAIWMAESMSHRMCEKCGSTQNIVITKGWNKTLCGECYEEYNKERKYDVETYTPEEFLLVDKNYGVPISTKQE